MTGDLNLWTLEYDDTSFEFGTHDTGYPFTKQVVIGPATVEAGEAPHPLSDGVVFGVDLVRGRTLQFAGAHLDAALTVPSTRAWTPRLDAGEVIEAAWASELFRRRGEVVAKLTNVDRGRAVYGRPRNYVPDLTVVRHGWSEWSGEFVTVDDAFYGADHVSVSNPGGSPGTKFPPGSLATNNGTRRAYPKITFEGECENPMLWLYTAADDPVWSIGFSGLLSESDPETRDPDDPIAAVLDCRPWKLGAVMYGVHPAPGRLLGARMVDAFLPAGGDGHFAFTTDAGDGTVTVEWSDTYGSL